MALPVLSPLYLNRRQIRREPTMPLVRHGLLLLLCPHPSSSPVQYLPHPQYHIAAHPQYVRFPPT